MLLAKRRIVDRGSFDELLARQPELQAMWQSYGGGSDEEAPPPEPAARGTAAA